MFHRRGAAGRAAGRGAKAPDVKYQAVGVGEGVFMRALYRDAFLRVRDAIAALGAIKTFWSDRAGVPVYRGVSSGVCFAVEE